MRLHTITGENKSLGNLLSMVVLAHSSPISTDGRCMTQLQDIFFVVWLILHMRLNTFDFRHLERTVPTVTVHPLALYEMTRGNRNGVVNTEGKVFSYCSY